MPPPPFQSPITGDVWPDIRPALGTLGSLATYLNDRRPRRKPPKQVDDAIKLATAAAGVYAGLPKISATGVEGTQASDAYWKAKDARFILEPLIGKDFKYSCICGLLNMESDEYIAYVHDPDNKFSFVQQTAIRFAYATAVHIEKAASSSVCAFEDLQRAIRCCAFLLKPCDVDMEEAASVERVWQFTCAAGRLPTEADADLLAAFEAALMAGANDFARGLAKNGFGVGTQTS